MLHSGFWGVSRHVNYLGEILMACGLALALGWPLLVGPWLYPLYYVALLFPRERDDDRRCAEKYGALWDQYRQKVPWRIVPKVILKGGVQGVSSDPIDLASVDQVLATARSVRRRLDFDRPVAQAEILDCINIATQAPTGLGGESWRFVVVTDPAVKRRLGGAIPTDPGGIGGRSGRGDQAHPTGAGRPLA